MKLSELANTLELELHGDPSVRVDKIQPISRATKNDLSFIVSARYKKDLIQSSAAAVIVPPSLAEFASGNYLISTNPYASYAKASWLLSPETLPAPGIAESAFIDASAKVDPSTSIGAQASIGANAFIDADVVIGENCVVGANARIGRGSRLFANVTVYHDCILGAQCRVQSGAVIGAEGFGYAFDNVSGDGWQAIHQTGRVVVGNKVHIGANTTIDRGAIDDTVISDGVILDNQIQIAHNVQIGENTAIAGCVGIAGSTKIGANCQIGGACNIVGHLTIVDGVILNATSYVSQSINESGRYGSGMPLQSNTEWKRSFVVLSKLTDLLKRVRALERSKQS